MTDTCWDLLYSSIAANKKPLSPSHQHHCVIYYKGKLYAYTELSRGEPSKVFPDSINLGTIDLSEAFYIEDLRGPKFCGPKSKEQLDTAFFFADVLDDDRARIKRILDQRRWLLHSENICRRIKEDGTRNHWAIYDAMLGKVFFPTKVLKKKPDIASYNHRNGSDIEYLGTVYFDCTTACFADKYGKFLAEDVSQKLRWLNRSKDEIASATKIYEDIIARVQSEELLKVIRIGKPPSVPKADQKRPFPSPH